MVYTVTLNPAVDYVVELDNLKMGDINRTSNEKIFFGGKGINVSIVLQRLGIETTAMGIIAGFTGKALENSLRFEGVHTDFLEADGFTRINIKIKSSPETELNGSGPFVDEQLLMGLIERLKLLKNDDIVVLSGSLPASLKSNTYKRIIDELKDTGVKIVLDTSGSALKEAVSSSPYLIKPNLAEMSSLLNKKLTVESEVIEGAKRLQKFGARNILVSMGSMGAIFVGEDGTVMREEAKRGRVINTVGSGDSMVAGFIAGLPGGLRSALRLGIAAGSATAFSEGLATKNEIMQIFSDK